MTSITTPTQLTPTLELACERWPDRIALTYQGEHTSYRTLLHRISTLANAYRRIGIKPGDRVVCQFVNCPEHLVAIGAAWSAGALHVGADNDLVGPELSELVARTRASAVLFQPRPGTRDPLAPVRAVREAHPLVRVVLHGWDEEEEGGCYWLADLLEGADQPDGPPGVSPFGPEDTALLLLTSGTTGAPKIIRQTLPAVWAQLQYIADGFGPGPDDVHLMVLPLSHGFGMYMCLMALASGGRVVVLDRFSPDEALRLITEERVTVLPGTVAHFNLMLNKLDPARHDVTSLRWTPAAAAALPPPLVAQMYGRLGVEIQNMYGASEGFITRTTDRSAISRGSIGKNLTCGPVGPESRADGRVVIVDPDDRSEVPVGDIGEIAFGAARPVDYWDAPPVATDGWYYTGDLGRVDPDDGCWFVLGRLKDLINRSGMKVAKGEVEAVLTRHPAVADGAVIATPDPVVEEAVCACIVPADGVTPPTLAELREFLGQFLARHKLPDELCVLEKIPRTKISKVDEAPLRATVLGGEVPRERLRQR